MRGLLPFGVGVRDGNGGGGESSGMPHRPVAPRRIEKEIKQTNASTQNDNSSYFSDENNKEKERMTRNEIASPASRES